MYCERFLCKWKENLPRSIQDFSEWDQWSRYETQFFRIPCWWCVWDSISQMPPVCRCWCMPTRLLQFLLWVRSTCSRRTENRVKVKQWIKLITACSEIRSKKFKEIYPNEHASWFSKCTAASAECQNYDLEKWKYFELKSRGIIFNFQYNLSHQNTESEKHINANLIILLILSHWDHECWIEEHPYGESDYGDANKLKWVWGLKWNAKISQMSTQIIIDVI